MFNWLGDIINGMGEMGAEIFDLSWVQATVKLFGLVTPMYVGAQAPNQLFMIDVADGSTLTWSDYS